MITTSVGIHYSHFKEFRYLPLYISFINPTFNIHSYLLFAVPIYLQKSFSLDLIVLDWLKLFLLWAALRFIWFLILLLLFHCTSLILRDDNKFFERFWQDRKWKSLDLSTQNHSEWKIESFKIYLSNTFLYF